VCGRAPRSLKAPFCASYSCVPLMMTVCAGRLTPQASVAVVHSTCAARAAHARARSGPGRAWPTARAARRGAP